MDKRTGLANAPTLLSLLLLMYFSIHVHCRIMDDQVNKKINLPHGLCVHKNGLDCCLLNDFCYISLDQCMDACKKSTYSSPGASATPAHPPLPSHTS
uniref:Uncharacterized protein n=1 Tax=Aegilops tauschii subsp. strangulata TaxID=200361 RepID=A0A453MWS1_AEGTS